jgi:hypothetical protein
MKLIMTAICEVPIMIIQFMKLMTGIMNHHWECEIFSSRFSAFCLFLLSIPYITFLFNTVCVRFPVGNLGFLFCT